MKIANILARSAIEVIEYDLDLIDMCLGYYEWENPEWLQRRLQAQKVVLRNKLRKLVDRLENL